MEKLPKDTNIIIVNDFDYIQGGASKVAIDTANLLVKNIEDINVYFFSGDHKETSTLDERIIRVCTGQGEALKDKNKIRGSINGIYNFKAKREFKKLLKSLNKENTIIHFHGWTKCLSSSVFDIAFKMKYKVTLTLHDYFTACPNGGYFNYKKNEICHLNPLSCKCIKCNCDSRNYAFKLYRILRQFVQNKVVRLNDKLESIITISDFSEKILSKTLNPKIKISRIYNPIDIDKNAKKVDLKNNQYYLYVGRVSKEKGVDLFCQAISELNLEGIVVGDGEQRPMLEKQYRNMRFVGWKDRSEVKKYMLGARALIFPSRWYEGAPLTPLEAMQYGVPCISSNCCACIEYIDEQDFEDMTFDLTKESLINAISKYDKNLKHNILKKIDIPQKYNKCFYINELMEVYKEIL